MKNKEWKKPELNDLEVQLTEKATFEGGVPDHYYVGNDQDPDKYYPMHS